MSVGPNGLHSGYRGIAKIGGTEVRFSDASISAKQSIEAPDLVMGDWDHDAYVYGKIEVGGSINGPVTEKFLEGAESILKWACARDTCGELDANDVHLYYYCGSDRNFTDVMVNNFSFSVAAGEVAQFSMDVIGVTAGDWGTETPNNMIDAEKLLTWDKCAVTITQGDIVIPVGNQFSNFEFSVANNVQPLYSLSQANLFPFDIVPGLRTLSGSLSVYNTPHFDGVDAFDDYCAGNEETITFSMSSGTCDITQVDITIRCRFHRIEPTLNSGTIISTLGFTGVSHQSGDPWIK